MQVELDLPAHAASWKGQYDFAWCSNKPGEPGTPGGGLPNPSLPSTFKTLSDLYGELAPLLSTGDVPSRVHLGGDEVERNCWTDDKNVQTWADAHGYRNDLQAWDCGYTNRTICR
jgi:N-acetyl-beta-hexosaminidase